VDIVKTDLNQMLTLENVHDTMMRCS